jgi:hypothetical protein
MAKPFRDAPLSVDDKVGLPLQDQRVKKAAELLGKMVPRFSDEFIRHVATEIGLDECITSAEDSEEDISFDLTALQLVALSSALAACAEFRDGEQAKRTAKKAARRERE